ncbi:hypothetical protein DFH09DRAFT_1392776 [Mycena vulgaris]|nr:hypothetical protein DFH09DRAFT_1392776 [Mycena vulgaris]
MSTRARTWRHVEAVESARKLWGSEPGEEEQRRGVEPAIERKGKEKRAVSIPLWRRHADEADTRAPASARAAAHHSQARCLHRRRREQHAPQLTARGDNGKHASRIIHAISFVIRLVAPTLSDPRAWKAVRMELIPVGVVENDKEEEEVLAVQDAGGALRRDAGATGRKERACWERGRRPAFSVAGPGAHPLGGAFSGVEDKTLSRGKVEKGTVEALVHELFFAAVFLGADAPANEAARNEEEWHDYALALLLCRARLVGRARVEAEFVRCAGYLVSGAVEEEIEAQCARVAWMAATILRPSSAFYKRDAYGYHKRCSHLHVGVPKLSAPPHCLLDPMALSSRLSVCTSLASWPSTTPPTHHRAVAHRVQSASPCTAAAPRLVGHATLAIAASRTHQLRSPSVVPLALASH